MRLLNLAIVVASAFSAPLVVDALNIQQASFPEVLKFAVWINGFVLIGGLWSVFVGKAQGEVGRTRPLRQIAIFLLVFVGLLMGTCIMSALAGVVEHEIFFFGVLVQALGLFLILAAVFRGRSIDDGG